MLASLTSNGVRLPRWAGVVLVAAAWALLPSTARAECGDYIHIDHSTSNAAKSKQPIHAPCHGPNCSKLPERDPLLPVSTPTVQVEHSACLSGDPVVPPLLEGLQSLDSILLVRNDLNLRLERPPRA